MMKTNRCVLSVATLLACLWLAASAYALERLPSGYYRTGESVRRIKVLLVHIDVFTMAHEMKELPPSRSKRAVIDMDVGKRFVWQLKRDVESGALRARLASAYAANGYKDTAKVAQFLAAFQGTLEAGQEIFITYEPDQKTTTVQVRGGAKATVPTIEFMRATWGTWLAGTDPAFGDALISRIPG